MKFATRKAVDSIIRKYEDVPFPDHDLIFRVREMSGTQRDVFESAIVKPAATNGSGKLAVREVETMYLRARLLVLCLVGEDLKPLYEPGDAQHLSDSIPASIQGKLFAVAQKLNGLEAVAVEDAVKNSESGQADASHSDLPANSEKPSLNS